MSARVQKTECWFSKREMLTGFFGKYNLKLEFFIYTGQMLLYSSVDMVFMGGNPHEFNVSHFLKEIKIQRHKSLNVKESFPSLIYRGPLLP